MTRDSLASLGSRWLGVLMVALSMPGPELVAQTFDSTGMPSLEQLATEAGRASRRHPVRALAPTLLCDPSIPVVDSASVAACAALDASRAAAIIAAFARGLEVPLANAADTVASVELAACPADIERDSGPRDLIARITAPVAGVREGVWEGRLTLEMRCRSPSAPGGTRTMGEEYLYQWSGGRWVLYQHSRWRATDDSGR